MLCGNCHKENPPSNAFCHTCGTRLDGQKAAAVAEPRADNQLFRCPKCNAANRPTMRFCRECGAELMSISVRSNSSPPKYVPAQPTNPVKSAASKKAVDKESPAVGTLVCSRCSAVDDRNSSFCRFCGAPLGASQPAQSPEFRDVSPSISSTASRTG